MKDKPIDRFQWWLTRRVETAKTLVFVVHTEIQENEEEGHGFISQISDLEPGTVIAAGDSVQEANAAAVKMFQDMVDDCLGKGTLSQLMDKSEIMQVVDQPLDKVMHAIELLERRAEHAEQRQRATRGTWLVGTSTFEAASA
jgi:hypothetical protein